MEERIRSSHSNKYEEGPGLARHASIIGWNVTFLNPVLQGRNVTCSTLCSTEQNRACSTLSSIRKGWICSTLSSRRRNRACSALSIIEGTGIAQGTQRVQDSVIRGKSGACSVNNQ